MSICTFGIKLKGKKMVAAVCGFLFLGMSIVVYVMNINYAAINFVLGLIACAAVILLVADSQDKSGKLTGLFAKYIMPIFLMHTLFAAPLRTVLLKIGITTAVVHVVVGLGISFVGPIVAAWIMEKTKWLEFFLYPTKFLRKDK